MMVSGQCEGNFALRQTIYEIHQMATQIAASGPDTYGYYFAGSCPGCNIFVTSPFMVAGGATIPQRNADDQRRRT